MIDDPNLDQARAILEDPAMLEMIALTAKALHNKYLALVEAGFSEDQALYITSAQATRYM